MKKSDEKIFGFGVLFGLMYVLFFRPFFGFDSTGILLSYILPAIVFGFVIYGVGFKKITSLFVSIFTLVSVFISVIFSSIFPYPEGYTKHCLIFGEFPKVTRMCFEDLMITAIVIMIFITIGMFIGEKMGGKK